MVKKTQTEIDNMKARYSEFPEKYMPMTRKKKSKTNELTHLILEHCKSLQIQAYRIQSQGQFDPRIKKFRPSMQKAGLPDVMIIYRGRLIGCEVKALKADKLNPNQEERRKEIMTAEGFFIEARSLAQFINHLKEIITIIDNGNNSATDRK